MCYKETVMESPQLQAPVPILTLNNKLSRTRVTSVPNVNSLEELLIRYITQDV